MSAQDGGAGVSKETGKLDNTIPCLCMYEVPWRALRNSMRRAPAWLPVWLPPLFPRPPPQPSACYYYHVEQKVASDLFHFSMQMQDARVNNTMNRRWPSSSGADTPFPSPSLSLALSFFPSLSLAPSFSPSLSLVLTILITPFVSLFHVLPRLLYIPPPPLFAIMCTRGDATRAWDMGQV